MQADEAVSQGRRLLERCLKGLGLRLEDVSEKSMNKVLAKYGFESQIELLEDIGMGNRPASLVVRKRIIRSSRRIACSSASTAFGSPSVTSMT